MDLHQACKKYHYNVIYEDNNMLYSFFGEDEIVFLVDLADYYEKSKVVKEYCKNTDKPYYISKVIYHWRYINIGESCINPLFLNFPTSGNIIIHYSDNKYMIDNGIRNIYEDRIITNDIKNKINNMCENMKIVNSYEKYKNEDVFISSVIKYNDYSLKKKENEEKIKLYEMEINMLNDKKRKLENEVCECNMIMNEM